MNNVQAGSVGLQQSCIRISGAEGVDAVESVLRTAVPEVAIIKDRVDHGRSIPRRRAPNVERSARSIGDGPDGIGNGCFVFWTEAQDHVIEIVPHYTLRSDDIIVVREHSGIRTSDVGQLVQREIADAELVVRAKSRMEKGGVG